MLVLKITISINNYDIKEFIKCHIFSYYFSIDNNFILQNNIVDQKVTLCGSSNEQWYINLNTFSKRNSIQEQE